MSPSTKNGHLRSRSLNTSMQRRLGSVMHAFNCTARHVRRKIHINGTDAHNH